jgi:hypothetical protein
MKNASIQKFMGPTNKCENYHVKTGTPEKTPPPPPQILKLFSYECRFILYIIKYCMALYIS